ncbi:helix-turn-helix domain-containing protein [Ensifer sp. 1H6]|uniref:MarR family transcriptional regulator n=1 Tax=Ensifer sp. 1H6 TaxID=1911585 RepID=UPI001FDA670C|nr:helix-turn-helix domain-containing protein [Ensifer sp. 1H6]
MRTEAWTAADVIGLNPTQLQILIFLVGRGKAGMRVKQIAAHLGVSQPTATDSINALTRKGFVEKLADPSDARAVAVAATAEGEAAVRRAGMIASRQTLPLRRYRRSDRKICCFIWSRSSARCRRPAPSRNNACV